MISSKVVRKKRSKERISDRKSSVEKGPALGEYRQSFKGIFKVSKLSLCVVSQTFQCNAMSNEHSCHKEVKCPCQETWSNLVWESAMLWWEGHVFYIRNIWVWNSVLTPYLKTFSKLYNLLSDFLSLKYAYYCLLQFLVGGLRGKRHTV